MDVGPEAADAFAVEAEVDEFFALELLGMGGTE
jgi:hypothetical protein